MKKARILLIVIAVIALTSIAATMVEKRVGERLNIVFGSPEMTFAANTPFHVVHGFAWGYEHGANPWDPTNIQAPGRGYFTLEVDGAARHFDFLERWVDIVEDEEGEWRNMWSMWVFNFPEGMEGDHTFVGTYYFPCKYIQLVCDDPNKPVIWNQYETLVHFEP